MKLIIIALSLLVVASWLPSVIQADDTEGASDDGAPVAGTQRRWCACYLGICYCRSHATASRMLEERSADAVDPVKTFKDANYNGESAATRGWCACYGRACYCRRRSSARRDLELDARSLTESESLQSEKREVGASEQQDDAPAAGSRRHCLCYKGFCYCRKHATARRGLDERSMTDAEAENQLTQERRADAADPVKTFKDANYNGESEATRGWCACYGRACYCRN